MGYEQYANPPGSYKSQFPKSGSDASGNGLPSYLKAPTPSAPPPKGAEGKFTELKVYGGVGNFHGNHFIAYFKPKDNLFPLLPSKIQIEKVNKLFCDDFCKRFSYQNIADAKPGKYKFNGKNTIQFQLKEKLNNLDNNSLLLSWLFDNSAKLKGIVHSDWVSIQMHASNLSFYGSTLKMNWIEDNAFALFYDLARVASGFGLKDKYQAFEFLKNIIEVNQHHFLAGRRSWAIGYDEAINNWYVETVAFERNSLCEYNMIDKYGNLREQIVALWVNLIHNFSSYLTPVFQPDIPKNFNVLNTQNYAYDFEKNVSYKIIEERSAAKLLSTPWFAEVIKRHQGLTEGL